MKLNFQFSILLAPSSLFFSLPLSSFPGFLPLLLNKRQHQEMNFPAVHLAAASKSVWGAFVDPLILRLLLFLTNFHEFHKIRVLRTFSSFNLLESGQSDIQSDPWADGQRDGQGWSCINQISIDQVKIYGTVGTASRGEEKKERKQKKKNQNKCQGSQQNIKDDIIACQGIIGMVMGAVPPLWSTNSCVDKNSQEVGNIPFLPFWWLTLDGPWLICLPCTKQGRLLSGASLPALN